LDKLYEKERKANDRYYEYQLLERQKNALSQKKDKWSTLMDAAHGEDRKVFCHRRTESYCRYNRDFKMCLNEQLKGGKLLLGLKYRLGSERKSNNALCFTWY